MGAPLTVEQMILNHNIGVNMSDASTFKGHQITDFSMVGHTHDASAIVSGVLNQARLPIATSTSQGIVQLSSSTTSNDNLSAATPAAVFAVKQEADGKANLTHTHNPTDINGGTFAARLAAYNESQVSIACIRNVMCSTSAPSSPIVGADGLIYLQYEA